MKKIALDHDLAQQVLEGTASSVWRVFDNLDLTVNDQVVLVDKMDTAKPAGWKVIGTARIDKVVEKRVGDLRRADYIGHDDFGSQFEVLVALRTEYGDRVAMDTPVKVIDFDFTPGTAADAIPVVPAGHKLKGERVVLYADGGSRGNPGPSACGYVLLDSDSNVLVDKGVYLGITTNNQAEYQGLKRALEEARAMGARDVDVRLDSMLVVNQMKGVFKVKNRELWPIHDSAKELVSGFRRVTFTHVPRELNKLADAAVNRALDEAADTRRQTESGPAGNVL